MHGVRNFFINGRCIDIGGTYRSLGMGVLSLAVYETSSIVILFAFFQEIVGLVWFGLQASPRAESA